VELGELARRYDAMLLVDEAHATGVFGEHGRGVVEHLSSRQGQLHEQVHVRIGTLSKALGSGGGFVCGKQSLIQWLSNRARSYVFSTAQPAAASAAALAALEIVESEPWRRQSLLENAARLRSRLRELGWNLGQSASQIIPVIVGSESETMRLARALRDRGLWVGGIRPPSVPANESLLRIGLSAAHSEEMLDKLVQALVELQPPVPQ
jgi:8-amino-7-oxononanoate synthase